MSAPTAPTSDINETTDTTLQELRALIREAEEALGSSGDDDQIDELRERLRDAVAQGQSMLSNLSDSVRNQAKRADSAIRENPYQTIGIAAGVGLIAGYLLSRRGGSKE
ncbi:MAG TPA: hypothetical protein VFE25_15170 [Opitutaceae bacterium]|jgi:ElaB protein|nr:hypothetical protein [Opitutaceae bacterium]